MIVISGSSSSISAPPGYCKIPVDLNTGAGGKYIYFCYRRGNDNPITGLKVSESSYSLLYQIQPAVLWLLFLSSFYVLCRVGMGWEYMPRVDISSLCI